MSSEIVSNSLFEHVLSLFLTIAGVLVNSAPGVSHNVSVHCKVSRKDWRQLQFVICGVFDRRRSIVKGKIYHFASGQELK